MPRARGDGKGFVTKTRKRKDGTEVKTLYVRVRYTGADGKRHAKWKKAVNRTDGKERKQDIIKEMGERGTESVGHSRRTFGELATYYAATSLVPAEYRDGRKIKGRRSLVGLHGTLDRLCEHFGARKIQTDDPDKHIWEGGKRLREITYDDIDDLRLELLATPIKIKRVLKRKNEETKKIERIETTEERPRKIATVNRALEMVRNMMSVAQRKGWILVSPFMAGERPLISAADEVKRKRICTFEEEALLYEQCTDRREHLRAIIMCALDTAMRAGEMFKMKVSELKNYEAHARQITIEQLNTKTLQERGAPISKRLQLELDRLLEEKLDRPDDLVFGVGSVKRSFKSACDAAGIKALRFHDLRRTAATRLHRGVPELGIPSMPIAEISRILGHASIATTYRYIGVDENTTKRAADLMDIIHEQASQARLKQSAKKIEQQSAP